MKLKQIPVQTLDEFLSQIKNSNPTNLDLISIVKAIRSLKLPLSAI